MNLGLFKYKILHSRFHYVELIDALLTIIKAGINIIFLDELCVNNMYSFPFAV